MWKVNFFSGFFILLLGFLTRKFNWSSLISGYNTLSKKEKEKYNEKILTLYVGNLFMISGLILMFGGILMLFYLFSQREIILYSWILFTLSIIFGLIYINLNKKIKKK